MDQKLKHFLDNSNFRRDRRNKKKKVETSGGKREAGQEEILMIKNGQIVVNDANMYVDTHRDVEMEVMEDDRIVTSSTFSKKKGALRWSKKEIELFYKALEICGIEFSLISSLFPNKERKHIKAKYIKEAKVNPERINEVLNEYKTFDQVAYNKLRSYLLE
ncbi:transcription initiation factor TFIIIB subunit Bdp1 [Encephalitozoon intestinalis ATCC 50506]|uniref:Transcription initiation factor TFIIIB subunit Bdp1 n=1 Tax=Encephalitozoon intestinalis (strain ATCC 50506) TaxID=876142 RepID=E0S6A2_ENCIT|nr:transcription initiation factor TFIIIB subunit Bdp1 [Encephalitozoon intestinalis ATCC 50506]ADM11237.1 transcription initiation factor TFIIIB subunit Bdp1 [Encephalitozoon intestinalis ATCC 50506]UTX44905.1 Myb DNA-binding-like protein [Encephalitozoon intestinalis]